jgi:hypothetical protein
MRLTPTPPSLLSPAALLLRDRRRSPVATLESTQIEPPRRRYQPIQWNQPATIVPTLLFNLRTASSDRLNAYPQR